MDIDYAFLCDHANTADGGGKVNALGIGIDTFTAAGAPFVHPLFYVVAQVRAAPGELNGRHAALHLVAEDETDVRQMPLGPVQTVAGDDGTAVVRMLIAVHRTAFPQFGVYWLRVLLDDQEITRFRLVAAQGASEPPTVADERDVTAETAGHPERR
jgi:hypothetical protein